MTPLKRILVPLDGSLVAESVLPHTHCIATTFESRLRLLHVLEHGRAGGLSRDAVEWRLRRAEATAYLGGIAERLSDAGLEVEAAVVEGRAAPEILSSARDWEADLIALSSHGHGGLDDFSLGGVAHKVVSRAGTSILLARAGEAPQEPLDELRYERIVAPVDGSRRADWALSIAARIARARSGVLQMLHVVAVPEFPAREPGHLVGRTHRHRLLEAAREAAASHLEVLARGISAPGIEVRSRLIESPRVARALSETDRQPGRSLMVMSAHGFSGQAEWLYGSVAGHLIAHGRSPLLVLQDQPQIGSHAREAALMAADRPLPWNR